MKTWILLSLAVALGPWDGLLLAADWPQFRGPNRNGISEETGLLKKWPEKGPTLVWTFSNAGAGFSGLSIVGDRLFSMGARGADEYVFAVDAKNGQELWAAKVGPTFDWKGNSWNKGPSATPTVAGDLIFALGGGGELVCVEAASGKKVWRKSMLKDLDGSVNPIGGAADEKRGWGYAWSPLADGDQLMCAPGGTAGLLASLDKKTGALKWRSKEVPEQATYSSPIVADIDGVRQYIEMTYEGMVGVAAQDGRLLWYYKRETPYKDVVIPTPLHHQEYVFSAVGWGAGCDLIKLERDGATFKPVKVMANKRELLNETGGVVYVDRNVYGYSNKGKGWECLEPTTGKVLWSDKRRLGSGSIIAANDNLYLFGEDDGVAVLLEVSNKAWKESGRFELPKKSTLGKSNGKLWTHPSIANGKLYLRDQDLIFCFDIKQK